MLLRAFALTAKFRVSRLRTEAEFCVSALNLKDGDESFI